MHVLEELTSQQRLYILPFLWRGNYIRDWQKQLKAAVLTFIQQRSVVCAIFGLNNKLLDAPGNSQNTMLIFPEFFQKHTF